METSKIIIIGKPFVNHVDQTAKPELTIDFLKQAYVRFYPNNQNLIQYGVYKSMGYVFNFKPYLIKFLYKRYGDWHEAYAPNKTMLRKVICGTIDKIILID